MKLKTLRDFNIKNKLILLRIGIDSPVVSGKVLDNPRFKEASQTITQLLEKDAKIVIIAHQGRKGDSDFIPLEQHAKILSKHVGKKIKYIDFLFEEQALEEIDSLKFGTAILMKNVREYEDELILENNRFYTFSELFDLYINDAFSVSHRVQGSIIIPPKVIPSCIGPNFEKELTALKNFHSNINQNAIYMIGGQKIEDYITLFDVLKNKNSKILASGVLANLFLISQSHNLGYEDFWVKEKGYDKLIPKLKEIYKKYSKQIILPIDFAIGNAIIEKAKRKEILLSDFPTNEKIWDIGHETVGLFKSYLTKTDYIFVKGPLGYSEIKEFSYSTVEILKEISILTKKGKVFSLLGGGHLSTTIQEYKINNNFSHISTSGGALISFISGNQLPGLIALEKGIQS